MTVAQQPPTSRPSIFDFTGRAKWDSWQSIGAKFANARDEGEARYVEIARALGWIEGNPLTHGEGSESEDEDEPTAEELLARDADLDAEGEVAGMGSIVSRLEAPEPDGEDDSSALHALAIEGSGDRVAEYLSLTPGVDVDARDGYVSTPACYHMQRFLIPHLRRATHHCS